MSHENRRKSNHSLSTSPRTQCITDQLFLSSLLLSGELYFAPPLSDSRLTLLFSCLGMNRLLVSSSQSSFSSNTKSLSFSKSQSHDLPSSSSLWASTDLFFLFRPFTGEIYAKRERARAAGKGNEVAVPSGSSSALRSSRRNGGEL